MKKNQKDAHEKKIKAEIKKKKSWRKNQKQKRH